MENEFDWSILENDNTERVKSFKEEIVDKTHLKIELAFHEASHFVFDCISSKFVCGFSPINFIISCADKLHENGFNRVNGFAPDIPEHLTYVRNHEEEAKGYLDFYNKDRKRLVAKLLSLVAGYSSYQIFVKDDDFFIAYQIFDKNLEDNTFKFNYYRKEYAFLSRTSDFIKLRKKLKVYYILEGDQALNATIKLIEKVQELMNIQAVNDSIRYVKNKLLKNECNKIEGAELEKLIIEVKRTTQRVLFENVLNQFVKEI